MFAARYWPSRYFCDRYWAKVGAAAPAPTPTPTPAASTPGGNPSSRRGIYTGRYIERDYSKRPKVKKLSRREKKLLNKKKAVAGSVQIPVTAKTFPKSEANIQTIATTQEIARQMAVLEKQKEETLAKAKMDLFLLESQQLADSKEIARFEYQKIQDEINLILMLADI